MLTGDLLRWDQEGYWSTHVRASFLMLLPRVGPEAFKVAAGGPDFGHLTITRFFALHAGVCSAGLVLVLLWHSRLLRKNGDAASFPSRETSCVPVSNSYWPGHALRNFAACAAMTRSWDCWSSRGRWRATIPASPRASTWAPRWRAGQSGRGL